MPSLSDILKAKTSAPQETLDPIPILDDDLFSLDGVAGSLEYKENLRAVLYLFFCTNQRTFAGRWQDFSKLLQFFGIDNSYNRTPINPPPYFLSLLVEYLANRDTKYGYQSFSLLASQFHNLSIGISNFNRILSEDDYKNITTLLERRLENEFSIIRRER